MNNIEYITTKKGKYYINEAGKKIYVYDKEKRKEQNHIYYEENKSYHQLRYLEKKMRRIRSQERVERERERERATNENN